MFSILICAVELQPAKIVTSAAAFEHSAWRRNAVRKLDSLIALQNKVKAGTLQKRELNAHLIRWLLSVGHEEKQQFAAAPDVAFELQSSATELRRGSFERRRADRSPNALFQSHSKAWRE